ncbi:MAG: response regulator [Eubacteriales bacterium]|nr:response regulator [Eubacteriales bacterium]
MLKLMIVDDEYIVRQGLRKIIPWDELDITICGEGEDVESAVEVARRVLPDIVICDIRLPGGEGFAAVDAIRKIVPWVQFIMITAYAEQDYVRQAIYKGACDYLFKPANVEDIKAAAGRASAKVLEYRERVKNDRNYQAFLLENLDVLRENLLVSLVKGHTNEEKLRQDAASLRICLAGPCYRILTAETEPGEEHCYQVMQQLAFCLGAYEPSMAKWEGREEKILVLLNCAAETTEDEIRKKLTAFPVENVRISKSCNALAELKTVRKEVGLDKEDTRHPESAIPEDSELQRLKGMLYEAVKYHDSAQELLRLFELYVSRGRELEIPDGRLAGECGQILDTIGLLTGVSQKRRRLPSDTQKAKEEFAALCGEIQESKHYKLDDASGKALYYIKKKYREDLSLEQIAAELFMSSSYLSRIIKERTGHGFGHWLNFYRIEEAKELLKDETKPIEQIAAECGYHSYRIFSENFRKYVGKTASAYRMELENRRKD